MSPPRSLRAHQAALHQAELLGTLQQIAQLEGQLMAQRDQSLEELRESLYGQGYPTPDERLNLLLEVAADAAEETSDVQSI